MQVTRIYKALASGIIPFEGAHAVHTPQPLVEEILTSLPALGGRILVLFNVEFVASLVYTFNVPPQNIIMYSDHENKSEICSKLGVKYITSLDTKMKKFDIIIGNPPFAITNNSGKRDAAANLWPMFVKKAEELTKKNGIFALITPNGWITPSADLGKGEAGLRVYNYMKKYTTIALNIEECGKHFTEGSTFTYFIIKKSENTHCLTKLTSLSGTYQVDLSKVLYFPSIVNEYTLSLNSKILVGDPIGFSNNNTPDSKKFESELCAKEASAVKCYHSSAAGGSLKYSRYQGREKAAKKVMVCSSGNFLPIYDNGTMGFTSKIYVYYLRSGETLKSIKSYLESKVVKVILQSNKTSGWVSYAFRLLPRINFTKVWTDEELYDYFNLSEQEREYINANA